MFVLVAKEKSPNQKTPSMSRGKFIDNFLKPISQG
jgi:hypothetical protein